MKKYLLMTLAVMFTMGAFAAGNGSGTKDDPIAFSWENGNELDPSAPEVQGLDSVWYRVNLDPLYDEDVPTLALYLTNLTNEEANVRMSATLVGQSETREYTIAGQKNMIWSRNASMLVRMQQHEVLLSLKANKKIALSAKVYETSYTDDACLNAIAFVWGGNGHVQDAGVAKWYKVDLLAAKNDASKEIEIKIDNLGSATAAALGQISPDCPSSGTTDYTAKVAAGQSSTKRLNRAMIDMFAGNEVYVKVSADQKVRVSAQLVAKEESTADPLLCEDVTATLALDQIYNVAVGTSVYKVPVDSLRGKKQMPEVTLVNTGSAKANIKAEVAFRCGPDSKDFITKQTTLAAGEIVVKSVEKNMVDDINSEFAYLRITTDQPLSFSGRLKNVREGDACRFAKDFVWDTPNLQDAGTVQQWYAIGVGEAKATKQDIVVTVINRASATATVQADLAFSCPYIDYESMTRTIAGKQEITKTIPYSSYAMMGSDSIYIGVSTDQPITIVATKVPTEVVPTDYACQNAIEFDWVYGHVLEANVEQWYKVNVDDVRNNIDRIPVLTITNKGAAKTTISAELSFECPVTVATTKRSLTISKDGIYTRELSRDMFMNISDTINTVYVKLTSTESISFQVSMQVEDEGASCASAKNFNWVSGETVDADEMIWFAIDLREAKASEQDIKLTITNKANTSAKVLAAIAPTCPCETPQEESTTLAAGAEKSKVLVNSTLEPLDSIIYVRISSTAKVHIQAELIAPEPIAPITACDPAINVLKGVKYTQNDAEAWYYVTANDLRAYLAAEPLYTPQVTIWNESGAKLTIKGEIAYHCPVTKAMQSKSISISGASITKILERELAEQYAGEGVDTIFVRLTGSNFSFQLDMVDANTGNDCAHAIILEAGPDGQGCYTQAAGESLWYRLFIKPLVATPHTLTGTITAGDADAKVEADLFNACGGELIQSGSRTIKANHTSTKEANSDVLYGLGDSVVYIHLTSSEAITFCLDTAAVEPLENPDSVCLIATPVVPNILYTQDLKDTVWYAVNIKNLKENTVGDAELVVKNLTGAAVKLKAEVSYECPVLYEMTSKVQTVKGNGTYTREFTRANINNVAKDMAYLRITAADNETYAAGEQISFILNIGQEDNSCLNPILFDWDNGNVHPADSIYFYQVVLLRDDVTSGTYSDSLRVPEGKDLRLHILNMEQREATANATLYFDCLADEEIESRDYKFTAGEEVTKDIDRDLLLKMMLPSIDLRFSSNAQMYIYAEFIDEQPMEYRDTLISGKVCDGYEYIDHYATDVTIDEEGAASNVHLIVAADPTSWSWSDTVRVQEGLHMIDSVYNFAFTPMVAPTAITKEGVLPVLAQVGAPLYVDALAKELDEAHALEAATSTNVLPVVNKSWLIWDAAASNFVDASSMLGTVLTDNTPLLMLYQNTTNFVNQVDPSNTCDDMTFDTVRIDVAAKPVVTQNDGTLYLCSGEDYGWRCLNGQLFDGIDGEKSCSDTYTITVDTLGATGLSIKVDSVFTKTFKKHKEAPETLPSIGGDIVAKPEIGWNDVINYDVAANDVKDWLEDNEYGYAQDELTWWRVINDDYLPLEEYKRVNCEETVVVCYSVKFCNETKYSALYTENLSCPDAQRDSLYTTLCEGSKFDWHSYIIENVKLSDKDSTFNDTVRSECGCVSVIYSMTLHVTQRDTIKMDTTVVEGTTDFKWQDSEIQTITMAYDGKELEYNDVDNCQTEILTLHVIPDVPARDTTMVEPIDITVCYGDEVAGVIITEPQTVMDTVIAVQHDEVGIYHDSIFTYNVDLYVSENKIELAEYVTVVCGQKIDLSAAEAAILDGITAPNAVVEWTASIDLTKEVPATTNTITLSYVVKSDCGDAEAVSAELVMETPSFENDVTLDRKEEVTGKYGDRILMINYNEIVKKYGEISEKDVTWYKEVDGGDDEVVATGFYYTLPDGAPIVGTYYALIELPATEADPCGGLLREKHECKGTAQSAPAIRPNLANPGETLEIYNLDPSVAHEIRVYDVQGELMQTLRAEDAESMYIQAAPQSGYYMVNIQGDAEQTTLKYIVK